MTHRELLESLLYLDREFIASAYEAIRGKAPATQIARSEGLNAGAKIPVFLATLSSSETKTFSISTVAMLASLLKELNKFPSAKNPSIDKEETSHIGWFQGELSISKVTLRGSSRTQKPGPVERPAVYSPEVEKASETFFTLRNEHSVQLSLITTETYFTSGISSLIRLNDVVTESISFPVKALVRVLPAKGSFRDWLAVPLVIYESRKDA